MISYEVESFGVEANPDNNFAVGYSVDAEGLVTTLREFTGDLDRVRHDVENAAINSGVIFEGVSNHYIPET